MKKWLTRIEKLDAQFPGLEDEVRKWFLQGKTLLQVSGLLFEHYQVSIPSPTVGFYRLRRWVPEQRLLREKRIELQAAQEVARERELILNMAKKLPREMR